VLFVDDEVQLCRSSRLILERLGYRASVFTDASEALEEFTRAPWNFDALLTDLTMPRLNGVELARRVLALRPDFPVVLLSGFSDKWTPERAAAVGIREVLEKPAAVTALAEAIRRALRAGTH
jgi:CheY-like chemotaxis protein